MVNLHAAAVNATFQNSPGNYLYLQQRYNTYFTNPGTKAQLAKIVQDWRICNSKIHKWSDLLLCEAKPAMLSDIIIDTTLQREVYPWWVFRILQNFKALQVRPISVYRDANQPDKTKLTAWDGQHTALALYIIAVDILGLDPTQCEIPVVVYNSTQRSAMREGFVWLNSPLGQQAVSEAELFRMQVLKVRCDGSKEPDDLAAEAKQILFERFGLFVSDKNSPNANLPGALTNMAEVLATGTKYTLSDLENFCKLFALATNSGRPVESKEMWQFMDYFRLCRQTGIKVDDAYLMQMATDLTYMFRIFGGDRIHDKGHVAYQDWYRNYAPGSNGTLYGNHWNSSGRKSCHLIWLTMVMRAHSSVQVPSTAQSWTNFPAQYLTLNYLQR